MTTVLFDEPGPIARRRIRIATVIGAVLVAAAVGAVVARLASAGQFKGSAWDFLTYRHPQEALVDGLKATLKAFAVAAVLALAVGLLGALGRLSSRAWIRWPATAFVTLFRALPVLVMMFFFYLMGKSPSLPKLSPLWAVILGLTLYNGSVLAEVFRAGVKAVPAGQAEAAAAVGLSRRQTLQVVLFPQAVRAMLPTIISQLVVVLKDTALGYLILYPELLFQANGLGNNREWGLSSALFAGAIYVVLCSILSATARLIERRTGAGRRRPGTVAPGVDAGPLALGGPE